MSGFKILVFIIGMSVSVQAQYSPDWKSLVNQIPKVFSQKRAKRKHFQNYFRIVGLYPNGMMKQKLVFSCTSDLLVSRVSKKLSYFAVIRNINPTPGLYFNQ